MLKVGASIPDVELQAADGGMVRLRTLTASWAVIYFYPKDGTFICTRQACAFRDAFPRFETSGVKVIGISADPPAAHRAFTRQHQLPFTLLSDPDDQAYNAFGLGRFLGLKARATFLVDPQGLVRMAFSSRSGAQQHVRRVLDALRAQSLARS